MGIPKKYWTDNELLEAMFLNDSQAILYFFYTRYYATFEYHLHKLFFYKIDVQAYVHEFFLYLCANNWKHLRTFNPENASLNTWVSIVSYRFFMNYKKSKIDSNDHVAIYGEWDENILQSQASKQEQIKMDVNTAIKCLPNEKEQCIARQLLLEECDIKDVAAENGMSIDYVYTVKSRAIKHLRNTLKSYRS